MKTKSLILAIILIIVCITPAYSDDFWEHINTPNDLPVLDVIKAPNGDLFACYNGIYRSTDNGITWFGVNKCLYKGDTIDFEKDGAFAYQLTVSNNGYIYCRTHFYPLVRSTNNGQIWTVILDKDASAIAVDSNRVFVELGDTVLYSLDNGENWVSFGFEDDWGDEDLKFDKEGNLLRCSYYGTSILQKGDSVFRKISSNSYPFHGNSSCFEIKDSIFFIGTYIALYISTNRGLTWDSSNFKLQNVNINSISIDSSGNIYACSQDSGIYLSKDNGNTWNIYKQKFYKKRVYKILMSNNDIFVAGQGLNYSKDGGNTWELRNSNMNPPYGYILGKDSLTYYMKTLTNLYYSNDNCKTWNIIESDNVNLSTINSLVIDNTGKLHILAQTGYYTSSDIGKTWIKDTNSKFTYPKNLKILKNGDLLISQFYYLNDIIFISKDNGVTWNEFSICFGLQNILMGNHSEFIVITHLNNYGFPFDADIYDSYESSIGTQLPTVLDDNETINGFVTDSNNYYFIGYKSGFWRSKDYGKNWVNKNNGLPNNRQNKEIGDMVMVNKNIYVTTPKGIYITKDFGDNWTDFNSGMTPANAYTVDYLDDGHLYATTTMGLFRSKNVINKVEENNINQNQNISLSPNPASTQLKIQFNEIYTESVSISIFNSLGVEVYSNAYDNISNNIISINTQEMPTGTYFCRFVSGRKAETKKFVIIK